MNSHVDPRPNAFQRRYFAWARPFYARMPQPLGQEAERIDRWLYSRAGFRFWLPLLALVIASAVGLRFAGMSWPLAVTAAIVSWLLILFIVLGAWFKHDCYTTPRLLRFTAFGLGLAYLGALLGFVVGYVIKHGGLDLDRLPQALAAGFRDATPWLVLLIAVVVMLTWGVAAVRRFRMQKEMQWLRLAQERDATARLLAEARLKLLQRQIQPHFIFNTLAAVQHWVDVADPRAGPLLRALTSFLRGSTELLALEQTPFAVEVDTLRHYLSVMQARLGDRLRYDIAIAPGADAQAMPAGLLLTLVENAIEHGIAPALRGGTVRVEAHRRRARVDAARRRRRRRTRARLARRHRPRQLSRAPAAVVRRARVVHARDGRRRHGRRGHHRPRGRDMTTPFDATALTALIADDEEAPRAQLRAALQAARPGIEIVAECSNGADAWDAWLEHQPQVCFLDIRMPGLTGIEVAQRIAGRTPIVFVTAYGDHAIEAFDTGAVDYLLKPVEIARVRRMIERLDARVVRPDLQGLLEGLSKQLRRPPPLEIIQSSVGREVRIIRVEDVLYFEADTRYTRVVHEGGDALIRMPLKELLVQLDDTVFWQIHRSMIVNRRCIEKATRIDEAHMEVTLRGRTEKLAVSRPFQGLFKGQ